MLLRIWRFISIYLTALTLSVILCDLLAGCAVLQLCAMATAAVSIKRSEHLTLDGTKLYLLTRGANRSAPVLLWLHGGPGGAKRPLFRYFNSELENHFVVAYWDQRGAGRSFDPKADPHRLTIANATVVRELQSIGIRLAADEGVQRKRLPTDCGIEAETACMSRPQFSIGHRSRHRRARARKGCC